MKKIEYLPTVKQRFGNPPIHVYHSHHLPCRKHRQNQTWLVLTYRETGTNGGTGRLPGDVHFNAAIDA